MKARLALLALAISLIVPAATAAHGVSVWVKVADCETGDGDGRPPYRADWGYNGRSGFDGGLQFLPSTWRMAAGSTLLRRYPYAYMAPAHVQIAVADAWLHRTSWGQWPACARKLGLR